MIELTRCGLTRAGGCSSIFKLGIPRNTAAVSSLIRPSSRQSARGTSPTLSRSFTTTNDIPSIPWCRSSFAQVPIYPAIRPLRICIPIRSLRHYSSETKPFPDPVKPNKSSNETAIDKLKHADVTTRKPTRSDTMKFLSLARPDLRTLLIGVLLVLVATCVNMSFPWYLGKIIDVFGAKGDNFFGFTFTQFFIALGLLFVAGSAASGGGTTYLRLTGEKIMARVRRTMYANIIRRETAFFDVNTTGDLTSRLLMDVSIVGSSLTQNVASGLKALLSGIIGLGMMTYISPSLTLYLAFIAPPTIYISAKYGKYVRKLSLQKQEAYGSLVKEAEERLNAVRTIQAFSTEIKEASRFSKRVGDVFGVARREAIATGLFTAGTNISEDAMNIIVLSLGGMMVLHDQMSVGQLFSYLFASFYVSDSLQSVGTTYSDIQKGVGAAGRLFPILEESTNAPQDTGKVIKSARGTLTFDNVTFAYPLRPNAPIFRHLSFEVNPGASVAIVARSGQGKSTIASLLLRYYDPQEGSIRINGHDIREYSLKSWRDQVTIVSQEPTLFSGSVGDNITYAIDGPVSMDEVRDVAYQASAGFVFDLPHQLDTDVGNRGTQMSGGMKQRIAIARALLKKPSIMILDEATSALDAASEQEINRVFRRLSHEGNKTIIIIAHKLSTIRSADVVVVLGEDGSLAEIGSFDDLSRKKDSAFNKLMASEFYGEQHEERHVDNDKAQGSLQSP